MRPSAGTEPVGFFRKVWRTDAGAQLAQQLFSRLVTEHALDDLALDKHDGRLDLRGFPMPNREVRAMMANNGSIPAEEIRRPEVSSHRLNSLDFTDAHFDGIRFFDADLSNCVCDGARFRDLNCGVQRYETPPSVRPSWPTPCSVL
jgi:uncharacterized protein YjbI with pentapeptide repeats